MQVAALTAEKLHISSSVYTNSTYIDAPVQIRKSEVLTMGFHFRKSFKLGNLIKINANKTGPSVSIGGKKLKVTLNKKKVTASLPGTGISYDTKLPTGDKKKTAAKKASSSKKTSSAKKK